MSNRRLPKPKGLLRASFWGRHRARIRKHLVNWALDPTQEDRSRQSEYADRTKRMRKMFDRLPGPISNMLGIPLLLSLRATRRNALVYEKDGVVNAQVVFQRHEKTLHIFHMWIALSLRRQHATKDILLDMLRFARRNGIRSIRLGSGSNPIITHIYDTIARDASKYGVIAREGYWFDII